MPRQIPPELAKRRERIKAQNAAFSASSQAEQRVAIAIDTIQQLHLDKFEARSCTYFRMENAFDDGRNISTRADLQEVLHDPEAPVCTVCARGAVFASAVRLSNTVRLAPSYSMKGNIEIAPDKRVFVRKEVEAFSRYQLGLMESAFERSHFMPTSLCRPSIEEELHAAIAFGEDLHDDSERLMAIMQNVINNKGEFVPTQKPKVLSRVYFLRRHCRKA